MSKGLEINAEIGLCMKDMAKENPIKDFEILIEEYKDKWSTQMYDYFKECLNKIKKELKEYEEMKRIKGTTTLDNALEETLIKSCPNVAKKLKALEIIKPLVDLTKEQKYCWLWLGLNGRQITQEEYDLLKEVLL